MNQNDLIDAIKHYIKTPKCYYSADFNKCSHGAQGKHILLKKFYTMK